MQREALGLRIREARKKNKLTQEKLAEMVGVTDVYICEIERGNKMPSIPVLIAIVEALDISADYLLRDNISSGKPYIYNEFTERLDKLSPRQRKSALELLDVYIKSLKWGALNKHLFYLFSFDNKFRQISSFSCVKISLQFNY